MSQPKSADGQKMVGSSQTGKTRALLPMPVQKRRALSRARAENFQKFPLTG